MKEYIKKVVYDILINEKIYNLPTLIAALSARHKINFVSYDNLTYLTKQEKDYLINDCGKIAFIFYDEVGHSFVIAYNNHVSEEMLEFAVAHEFGHFFLNHINKNNDYLLSYLHNEDMQEVEEEANLFAVFLLCPPIIINECGIKTEEELSRICYIPVAYAGRILNIILQEKKQEITMQEIKLKKQFKHFIKKYKADKQQLKRGNIIELFYIFDKKKRIANTT